MDNIQIVTCCIITFTDYILSIVALLIVVFLLWKKTQKLQGQTTSAKSKCLAPLTPGKLNLLMPARTVTPSHTSHRRVRVQDTGHAADFYFCQGFSTICMQGVKCGKIVAYWKVDNVLLLTYIFKAIFSHQLILLLALCLKSLSSSPPLYCALELSSVAKQSSPEANCTG